MAICIMLRALSEVRMVVILMVNVLYFGTSINLFSSFDIIRVRTKNKLLHLKSDDPPEAVTMEEKKREAISRISWSHRNK